MRVYIPLLFLFASLLDLHAEARTHDGLVKINAEEVKAAQALVSLSVIPSITALHEWLPKALAEEDDIISFQQELIAPKLIFTESLGILSQVETYLREDTAPQVEDIKSLQADLKMLASAQFYCLEMYSVFSDPKLPMSKEEREQLTQSIKKASKVYLGVTDLLLTHYAVPDGNNIAPQQSTPSVSSTPEYASIPYQSATLLSLIINNPTTNSFVNVRIQSRLKDVKPSDIDLYIDSEEGKIPLKVEPDGICRVPFTDPLIYENPKIVSNQPKESLTLETYIELKSAFSADVDNNRIRYNDLMRSVQLINNQLLAIEKVSEFEPDSLPMIALRIQYPEIDLPAAIVIEKSNGDVSIPVSPEKWCLLEDRKSMRDENPWVKLPPYSFHTTGINVPKPENWEEQ